MSDYISREAAIKAVQEEFACETCNGGNIGTTCMFCNVGNAIRRIKNVPAADVAEVLSNYCPCCGAKMDLEDGNG